LREVKPSEEILFDEALALTAPQERAVYLARACQGDESLRRRVEALIAAYAKGEFLESPADAIAELQQASSPGSLVGAQIGSYAVRELIGEGGMGDVYLARGVDGNWQTVALKVIKPGMDSRQVIARFELERTSLAKMDHRHIAQFIEAGVSEQGRAYFAMELVTGLPITEYCDRQRLPVAQRLKLMVDLCLAVEHAHSKGLVHRDLKPGNVLVTEVDGEPVLKVIDFGVAKALDRELSDRTIFTRPVQFIGTPIYMSPEQVRWCPDVDIRSDVYSIGVLLYELLSGSTPIEKARLHTVGFEELRRIIQEEEAAPPSERIASLPTNVQAAVAAARGVNPKQLKAQVRGDLDWITLMALAKDRAARYATAMLLGIVIQCLSSFTRDGCKELFRQSFPGLAISARFS
jgi:serine/threonine protein kinase